MRRLQLAIRCFCVIPFVTGGLDVLRGIAFLKSAGARLDDELERDPVLNSQIKFWGAIWFGYGVLLFRASSHLRDEPNVFKALCGMLALSGVARTAAAASYGSPGVPLTAATIIELAGGSGFFAWHAAALRRPIADDE